MPLTPNSPAGRFEHVIKTMWGKGAVDAQPLSNRKRESLDAVVLDTFYVTTSLVGAHDLSAGAAFSINRWESGSPYIEQHAEEIFVERVQKRLDVEDHPGSRLLPQVAWAKAAKTMLARLGQPYEYDAKGFIDWDSQQWGLAELVLQVVRLPEHNRYDFLIPWVGRELSKLAKEVFKGARRPASAGRLGLTGRLKSGVTATDYWDAVHALYDKAPAIAQWAKETRADIGKVDLATALEAIKTYEFKTSLVEQGTVVYTFRDGWTVQELRTESALSAEGTNMQNCIASYHDSVEAGGTRIYSIRDKSGNPHVSMELRGVSPVKDARIHGTPMSLTIGPPGEELSPEEFVRSPARMSWHFKQVLGKQNDKPIDEYRTRAREFIDKVFDKEGFGWIIAGGTPKWARFAGRQLNDLDVPEILGPNHLDGDELVGADFTDANLTGTVFTDVNLSKCNFTKARASEAKFDDATLDGAKFDGARCRFANFTGASLRDASFDSASLQGSAFLRADVTGASFRDANVDGAVLGPLKGGQTADWSGVELTDNQRRHVTSADVRDIRDIRRPA